MASLVKLGHTMCDLRSAFRPSMRQGFHNLQAVLINSTMPNVLPAPPPPPSPPPPPLPPPPFVNSTAAQSSPQRMVVGPSKAASVAIPSVIFGLAAIAVILAGVLW